MVIISIMIYSLQTISFCLYTYFVSNASSSIVLLTKFTCHWILVIVSECFGRFCLFDFSSSTALMSFRSRFTLRIVFFFSIFFWSWSKTDIHFVSHPTRLMSRIFTSEYSKQLLDTHIQITDLLSPN